jgi:hypothetical protein
MKHRNTKRSPIARGDHSPNPQTKNFQFLIIS